jgi:hypothetical protein
VDDRVITAAELDAMTPEQRRQHFEDSIVDPATLTDEQRARIYARQRQAAERQQPAS